MHVTGAATLPCKIEHSVNYYLTTAKWTKISKKKIVLLARSCLTVDISNKSNACGTA